MSSPDPRPAVPRPRHSRPGRPRPAAHCQLSLSRPEAPARGCRARGPGAASEPAGPRAPLGGEREASWPDSSGSTGAHTPTRDSPTPRRRHRGPAPQVGSPQAAGGPLITQALPQGACSPPGRAGTGAPERTSTPQHAHTRTALTPQHRGAGQQGARESPTGLGRRAAVAPLQGQSRDHPRCKPSLPRRTKGGSDQGWASKLLPNRAQKA